MRLSTILTLALGVIAPLAEAAALAPPTDATTPLAEAPALAPLADATVEAATNGTMGALARRAGYQNYRYADCQNAGPVRFMDEGICYVVAESTHAIRLNDVPPNCAGKSPLPAPFERVAQLTGAICSLWVCFHWLHEPYMVHHEDSWPVHAHLDQQLEQSQVILA